MKNRIIYRIMVIIELLLSVVMSSNMAFAKYVNSNEITVANVDIEEPKGVYIKLFDLNDDGVGETLVFNNTPNFTYEGNMIRDYSNINNNEYQTGGNPVWRNDRKTIKNVIFLSEIKPNTTKNWFLYANNLENISNIEYLNLSNITDMSFMFSGCVSLTNIDVSHFNTSGVINMTGLFNNCRALQKLDLSSFNTSNVTNMMNMFSNCNSLTTIYVSDNFNVDSVSSSDYMFNNCNMIVGGSGTVYDPNRIDKQMANYVSGYFSTKSNNKSTDNKQNNSTEDVGKADIDSKNVIIDETTAQENNVSKTEAYNKLPRTGI